MKIRLTIFLLATVAFAAGCGQNAGRQDDMDTSKLIYAPEVNTVDVISLKRTVFNSQLAANGKVNAIQKTSLSFRSGGTLTVVNVRNGSHVQKGQLLAAVDSSSAVLAVHAAKLALEKAGLDLRDVLAGQGYNPQALDDVPDEFMRIAKMRSGYDIALNNLKKAEYELDGTRIFAPFSGVVADVKLKKYGTAGSEPFCTLLADGVMDAVFSVLESEYKLLQTGLHVKIEPFAEGGHRLDGTIGTINPTVDRNGQITVCATVRNDGSLVDGMNVRVFVEKAVPDQLVVPRSAVVIRDNQEVLFRYKNGKALWTYVKILMSNSDSYAITANTTRGAELFPGDSVIVSGNLNLADGSDVVLKK